MAASDSTQPPNDYQLMQHIAERQADALAALFDRHGPAVYALGLRMLREPGLAEELLSDVFLEIWTRCERYDPSRAAPVTYVMILARSRAIDRRRSTGHSVTATEALDDSSQNAPTAKTPNPADSALHDELRGQIRKAMQQLEPDQRQAVELSFFDGLSHSEIAAKLGKPLGTIKSQIRKGLIRLRDGLRTDNG
jgi:RNA polymerase sigma-70 factor, ECF subfamily